MSKQIDFLFKGLIETLKGDTDNMVASGAFDDPEDIDKDDVEKSWQTLNKKLTQLPKLSDAKYLNEHVSQACFLAMYKKADAQLSCSRLDAIRLALTQSAGLSDDQGFIAKYLPEFPNRLEN